MGLDIFVDGRSVAGESGNLRLSKTMLKAACPFMFGRRGLKLSQFIAYQQMREFMMKGDSQPAIVYSVSPFLIAAYSDEMDAVVMLRFDEGLAQKYGFAKGARMISVNVYANRTVYAQGIARDIMIGPGYLDRYIDFSPHIGDLLCDDAVAVQLRKRHISEQEWAYVEQLAQRYVQIKPGVYRDGRKGLKGFGSGS